MINVTIVEPEAFCKPRIRIEQFKTYEQARIFINDFNEGKVNLFDSRAYLGYTKI